MNDAAAEAALRAALGVGLMFVGACLLVSVPVVLVRGALTDLARVKISPPIL